MNHASARRRLAGGILGSVVALVLVLSLAAIDSRPQTQDGSGIASSNEDIEPPFPASSAADETISTFGTIVTTTTVPTTTSSTAPTTTVTSPATTVTSPATTVTSPATTVTLPPVYLDADGLGLIDLGTPYEETVEAVTAELGEPNADSGWIGSESEFGTCPGTVVRVVRWHSLRLFFSDGPTEFGSDERHFFYFSQSTVETDEVLDLATARGIHLGSTVADLRDAYGPLVTVERNSTFGTSFAIESPGSSLLAGTLSSAEPNGEVTSIGGGFGCGA